MVTQLKAPGIMQGLPLDFKAQDPTKPAEPGDYDTAIELPTRLILSPNRFTRFRHEAEPVESSEGGVELWHTRLAALPVNGAARARVTKNRARPSARRSS